MSDLPAIGSTVHAVTDESGTCVPLIVHAHMTPTHLALADTPPSSSPEAPRPTRTWFAVLSDSRENGTWHPACD
jgi:hypothetical protein